MPGWDGRLDSSTDGDDLDDSGLDYLDSRPGVHPAPSGIVFEGEAVIINGRSNLQRQPRSRKVSAMQDVGEERKRKEQQDGEWQRGTRKGKREEGKGAEMGRCYGRSKEKDGKEGNFKGEGKRRTHKR